ncbi:MAG: RES family NAD+ phosphorylase [Brucella anthropi]
MGEQIYCDEAEPKVGICLDCARHASLKRAISEKSIKGLCGLCERPDVVIGNPEDATAIIMLVRSLVRFYWHEHEYNPHWGGADPLALLSMENNPVAKPPKGNTYRDELEYALFDPPYVAVDEGVTIYAGFNEGIRCANFAISSSSHFSLSSIGNRLLRENFFEVEPSLEELLSPFINELSYTLPAGTVWFRARLGQKARFHQIDGWDSVERRQPWLGDDIGAPPPTLAGNGRLNRTGVSVLYLASNVETAVAEIRPHPGHYVSVGGFQNKEDLRIAAFNPDIFDFSANDVRLDYYHIINDLDKMMSFPVVPEEKSKYLLTQLLGEFLTRKGFDGAKFRSSVADGENICIFNSTKFPFVEGYSEVLKINALKYSIERSESVIKPENEESLYEL